MCQEFDIYVFIFLIKNIFGFKICYDGIDFVIICENIEGEYSGFEYQSVFGVVEFFKIIICVKFECIVKFVFSFVFVNYCKKVICIYKVNIMKFVDGFFCNIF